MRNLHRPKRSFITKKKSHNKTITYMGSKQKIYIYTCTPSIFVRSIGPVLDGVMHFSILLSNYRKTHQTKPTPAAIHSAVKPNCCNCRSVVRSVCRSLARSLACSFVWSTPNDWSESEPIPVIPFHCSANYERKLITTT